jgi:hypothetical protein
MSPRKQKEKELTLEEALELARKELAPQWHLSKPLLAGVRVGEKVNVVPLEEEFSKKDWIILFCDPTDFSGEAAILFFKDLVRRYQGFGLSPLVVARAPYEYLKDRDQFVKLIDTIGLTYAYVVDHEDLIATGFRVEEWPAVVVWKQNILRLKQLGKTWFGGLELEIQKILREDDLGLPLWLPFGKDQLTYLDAGRLELGSKAGTDLPKPDFQPNAKGVLEAKYLPTDLPGHSPFGHIALNGVWQRNPDALFTEDPEAWIELDIPSSTLGVFASHLGKKDDTYATLELEVKERAVPDVFAGPHLIYNDEGRSILRVVRSGFYKVLTKLPVNERRVRIRFPYANQTGCVLYGFRFAE